MALLEDFGRYFCDRVDEPLQAAVAVAPQNEDRGGPPQPAKGRLPRRMNRPLHLSVKNQYLEPAADQCGLPFPPSAPPDPWTSISGWFIRTNAT